MLKKILIAVAALVVVFLGVVALQPADFVVTRSAVIAAPPAVPFAQVNDFQKWQAWSPWAKIDPAMKNTFEGPDSGKGAIYRWVGNSAVGEGAMTITESRPSELIRFDLEFIKPMPGKCPTEFTFKSEGTGTRVTWTMSGQNSFVAKAFCLFMSMDKMVGGQFEQGLASMKSIAETPAPAAK